MMHIATPVGKLSLKYAHVIRELQLIYAMAYFYCANFYVSSLLSLFQLGLPYTGQSYDVHIRVVLLLLRIIPLPRAHCIHEVVPKRG
jgi:hypothetical protein